MSEILIPERIFEFLEHAGVPSSVGDTGVEALVWTFGRGGSFPGQVEAALRQASLGNTLAVADLEAVIPGGAEVLLAWLTSDEGIATRQRAEGRLAARPFGRFDGVRSVDADDVVEAADIPAWTKTRREIADIMTSLGRSGTLEGDTPEERTYEALRRAVSGIDGQLGSLSVWVESAATKARMSGVLNEIVMASAAPGQAGAASPAGSPLEGEPGSAAPVDADPVSLTVLVAVASEVAAPELNFQE